MSSPNLRAPLLPALEGRYYTDPAVFEREQASIFREMWVYVGRAELVEQPGSYLAPKLGGEGVLVVRGKDDVLRGFYNVCPHRGSRLTDNPQGQFGARITCPYHAWSFGLDGRLAGGAMLAEMEERGFDRKGYGLAPISVEVWQGMVWASLASSPNTLHAQVSEAVEERFPNQTTFGRYGLGTLRLGKTLEYEVAANWKLVIENFMECTHCGPMHPDLCRVLPSFRGGKASYHGGEAGVTLSPSVEAFTMSGKKRFPSLPGLIPDDERRFHAFVLRPNVLMVLVSDHVVTFALFPKGPAATRVRCEWLFSPEAIQSSGFDPSDAVVLFDNINQQDWKGLALVQEGVGSSAFSKGGVLAPSEEQISGFYQFVLERIAKS